MWFFLGVATYQLSELILYWCDDGTLPHVRV
jgi:hypothetical protein